MNKTQLFYFISHDKNGRASHYCCALCDTDKETVGEEEVA